jgi:hypothetical protein
MGFPSLSNYNNPPDDTSSSPSCRGGILLLSDLSFVPRHAGQNIVTELDGPAIDEAGLLEAETNILNPFDPDPGDILRW